MARRGLNEPEKSASVADSWRRIEAWLDAHLPAVKATFRAGVSKKDLTKFEKLIGRPLPDDVRESWMIHDGQGGIPDDYFKGGRADQVPESLGLFFGLMMNPLLDSREALSDHSVLSEWTRWKQLIEGEEPSYWDEFDENCTSFPAGTIQCRYSHSGWLPLLTRSDAAFAGVDLDPGAHGVVGQVVNFGRTDEEKYVLALSWTRFLEDFTNELQAGNFVIEVGNEFGDFQMKEPAGPLGQNYKAWSQARFDR